MSVRARHAVRSLAVLACAAAFGVGCAKDPTSVLLSVDADPSAPPILILRTTVARVDDPTVRSSTMRASPNAGDAADRPGPFVFPFEQSLNVDPIFVGDVTLIVDALDWDSSAVTASGSTPAVIAAQKQATASLTLEPIRGGGADGGID